MRRLLAALVLTAGLLVGPGLSASEAAPSTRGCATAWGSTPEQAGPDTRPRSPIVNARTGEHACFDRFVVDVRRQAPGYHVRYVSQFRDMGKGNVIPLAGGARLEIIIRAADHTLNFVPTYHAHVGQPLPGVNLAGYQTFRSAKYGGSFEGISSFGLGVRARLPFRVFKLDHHVVVDVAHHWP